MRFWFFSLNRFGKWPLSYIILYVEFRRDDANSGCGNPDLEHGHHHCLEQVEHDGFQKKLLINYLLDCVLFPPKIMMAIVLQAWNGLTNKHSAACDGRL